MTGEIAEFPHVRPADDEDMEAITAIYAHHVLNSLATFEEVPPTLDEMIRRRADMLARGLPYVVAVDHDNVVHAYAYAAPFRPRSAYRYTVEDSVYVAPDARGQGYGRAVLGRVVEMATEIGMRNMIAVIGDSANSASIALHSRLGFEQAGVLRSAGFKFNRWVDAVIMQRPLGVGTTSIPFEK